MTTCPRHLLTRITRSDLVDGELRTVYIGHTCLHCGDQQHFADGKPPAPPPLFPKAPSIAEADIPY